MKKNLNKFKKIKNKKAAASLIAIVASVVVVGSLSIGILSFLSTQARETAKNEINNTMNTITDIAEANRNNTDIVIPDDEPIIPPETKTIYYANINTGTVYDAMPVTVSDGDVYIQGDYLYFYSPSMLETNGWLVDLAEVEEESNFGYELGLSTLFPDYEWTDRNQTSYGEILSSVNGINVTIMSYTFADCTSLTKAPTIPNSVTDMEGTFWCCTALKEAPAIPSNVTDMTYTFYGCTALETAPDMSNATGVTNMLCTFQDCTSLTDVSDLVIPSNVIIMEDTFIRCTALTEAPDMSQASSVTSMGGTFNACTALEKAPAIPTSVTDMKLTFYGCTSLTGEVEINATNLTYYNNCFCNTEKPIKIIGSTPYKAELAATANKDNVTY